MDLTRVPFIRNVRSARFQIGNPHLQTHGSHATIKPTTYLFTKDKYHGVDVAG